MARHSHWAQIKLKKGALDKKRGKIFTRHARLIEIAARKGGSDPSENASLRLAIDNARADNLPKENIERAIKKGTGEAGSAQEMQEVSYEGFGPGGVALVIDVFTDNKNRTNQTVRNILQKHGGSLGAMGCTSFMFEVKGVLHVKMKDERDSDELEVIDAGAQDVEEVEGGFVVYTAASELGAMRKKLTEKGFTVESAELSKIPKDLVEVEDLVAAKKVTDLVEALEEEEDVSGVSTNADLGEVM